MTLISPRALVFFDLETAGLEPNAEIIQLAAVAIELPSWRELDSFQRKLQFDEALAHPKALEVNHYDKAVWFREAVSKSQALFDFARWLRQFAEIKLISKANKPYFVTQMAGYNSENFDQERLQAAFKESNIFYPAHYRTLDVLQLAAWNALTEGLYAPSLKLSDVAERFEIPTEGAHDALADVRMTIAVARKILSPQESKEDTSDVQSSQRS